MPFSLSIRVMKNFIQLRSEKNYSITELETLAVVWAMSHFHAYVYGNEVLVYTDHSAVKAILETLNTKLVNGF